MTDDEIIKAMEISGVKLLGFIGPNREYVHTTAGSQDVAKIIAAARAIIAQARAELIAEITAPGPVAYKWRTAARFKTGTPGPWHLSLERFDPVPREVDEIACYAIPKE